jgi:hypothetical protein
VRTGTERSGVVVISAWTEDGGTALRVRITAATDLVDASESTQVVATSAAACMVVEDWLDSLLCERSPHKPPRSIP